MQREKGVSFTIETALRTGAAMLADSGVDEPRREAALLLTNVLQRPRAFLIAHPEYEIPAEQAAEYLHVARRRSLREPFHYITGTKEFYGLDFNVGPGVLIPRPETEILVAEAINILTGRGPVRFLEVGVGSGCISISILHSIDTAQAVGVDISPDAIRIACRNAVVHNVGNRFEIRLSDLYQAISGLFDLIVSNPPYIPEVDLDTLSPEIRNFEPGVALFSGIDGLAMIRDLIDGAPIRLKPAGSLLIEIGAGQAKDVRGMFPEDVWHSVGFIDDLQGIPRVVRATLAGCV